MYEYQGTYRRNGRYRLKRDFLFCVWSLLFAYYYCVTADTDQSREIEPDYSDEIDGVKSAEDAAIDYEEVLRTNDTSEGANEIKRGRWEQPGINCTPPGIDDFPLDLFTQKQRQSGFVIVHFIVSMYIFYALAIVCDDYFVPSMERICEELKMPSDVAGATFMAIATSAPELFTNIIGTFITRGDIGIGTIVGSAVFNILAVAAVCGIGAGMVVPLEWWSVTRDCICYSITVVLLIAVLRDERIYWYEALILVLVYVLYILVMYKNSMLKRGAEKLVMKAEKRLRKDGKVETTYTTSKDKGMDCTDTQLNGFHTNGNGSNGLPLQGSDTVEIRDEMLIEQAVKNSQAAAEGDGRGLCHLPWDEGFRAWIEFFIGFPIRLMFTFTIPDCREPRWRRFYPLTFFMCIVWIGTLSYVVNWMMTVIGHTLKVPDSVMGLTFIAAGTSVPEIVSSLIVARQGLGTMAVSNSIGSNTFDILMCLGIPWLIRASYQSDDEIDYVKINSTGLEYSTMMLITSLVVLYCILALNKFKLDKKVGLMSLFLYAIFLVMASLFELNVFFDVNMPTCLYHED